MLPIPVLWNRGNDLDIHIDVPMYLLFFRITKSIVSMIKAWCALPGSTHDFMKHIIGVMETFYGLGLSWLVCVPCTGAKLGGLFQKTTWLWLGSCVGSIQNCLLL
jgi:hypothetical protein